jgi:16S rRNA (guanine(527)-N(7))-methyltransferase RsmG
MAVDLPVLSRATFLRALAEETPEPLGGATESALWAHYLELQRWGRRLSLIGPGTAHEVVERHYGESLAALPWCPPGPLVHVDLGSGGGFPGVVLAAARPLWKTTLVEPRERKWAFLQSAIRHGELSCHCLNARVDDLLPAGFPERFDVVSIRALRLPLASWEAICSRLSKGARVLWWQGEDGGDWPPCLRLVASKPLAKSRVRRLIWAEPVKQETSL